MSKGITEIPVITDPMGKYWEQPPREAVLIDDEFALMESLSWDRLLHHYDRSIPRGTYVGKMWGVTDQNGKRYLRWFHKIVGDQITIETRQVLIL